MEDISDRMRKASVKDFERKNRKYDFADQNSSVLSDLDNNVEDFSPEFSGGTSKTDTLPHLHEEIVCGFEGEGRIVGDLTSQDVREQLSQTDDYYTDGNGDTMKSPRRKSQRIAKNGKTGKQPREFEENNENGQSAGDDNEEFFDTVTHVQFNNDKNGKLHQKVGKISSTSRTGKSATTSKGGKSNSYKGEKTTTTSKAGKSTTTSKGVKLTSTSKVGYSKSPFRGAHQNRTPEDEKTASPYRTRKRKADVSYKEASSEEEDCVEGETLDVDFTTAAASRDRKNESNFSDILKRIAQVSACDVTFEDITIDEEVMQKWQDAKDDIEGSRNDDGNSPETRDRQLSPNLLESASTGLKSRAKSAGDVSVQNKSVEDTNFDTLSEISDASQSEGASVNPFAKITGAFRRNVSDIGGGDALVAPDLDEETQKSTGTVYTHISDVDDADFLKKGKKIAKLNKGLDASDRFGAFADVMREIHSQDSQKPASQDVEDFLSEDESDADDFFSDAVSSQKNDSYLSPLSTDDEEDGNFAAMFGFRDKKKAVKKRLR